MDLFEERGAKFSDCGKYRYILWRIWDKDTFKPIVAFIGLNPSKADSNFDDPTIKRCRSFAKRWGYRGFLMYNLFAYRATKPKELTQVECPVGKLNDSFLRELSSQSNNVDIVFAWGAYPKHKRRIEEVMLMFPHAFFIDKSKDGYPRHPLFLKGDLKLKIYFNPTCHDRD